MKKISLLLLCWACCLVASAQTADGQRKLPLDSLEFHDLLVAMCDTKNETFHSADMVQMAKERLVADFKEYYDSIIDVEMFVEQYASGQLKEDLASLNTASYEKAFDGDMAAFRTAVAGLYKKNGIVLRAVDKGFYPLLSGACAIVAATKTTADAINGINELMPLEGEAVPEEFRVAFEDFYKRAGYWAFIDEYLGVWGEQQKKVAAFLKEASVDFFANRLYAMGVTEELLRTENPAVELHGKLLWCHNKSPQHLAATKEAVRRKFAAWLDRKGVDVPSGSKVYAVVGQPPTFPGGESALLAWVGKNIRYPQDALEKGTQGVVLLRFVVLENGSIGDVTVTRKLSPSCDAEAVRVVKSLPRFIPARNNGKPVKVWYTLPIRFHIQEILGEDPMTRARREYERSRPRHR